MSKIQHHLKQRMLSIIKDEYEDCSFFTAAAQLLTNKFHNIAEDIQNDKLSFNELRDTIGEIGIFISNTEKRLNEVEECYTKLVEAMADDKPEDQ